MYGAYGVVVTQQVVVLLFRVRFPMGTLNGI